MVSERKVGRYFVEVWSLVYDRGKVLREIPLAQCSPCFGGGYTLELVEYFDLHYSAVICVVGNHKSKTSPLCSSIIDFLRLFLPSPSEC